MERGWVRLKTTLAANFTRRRPQSDASLFQQPPVTDPLVHNKCHMIERTRKSDYRKKQTTGEIQSRDPVICHREEVSSDTVTPRAFSDRMRSTDDGLDRPQRRNVRERLSAYIRRQWSQLRQNVKVLKCTVNSQTSC